MVVLFCMHVLLADKHCKTEECDGSVVKCTHEIEWLLVPDSTEALRSILEKETLYFA